MQNRKEIRTLMIALLSCLFTGLLLAGCGKSDVPAITWQHVSALDTEKPAITGQHVSATNPDAPKEIQSTKLLGFQMNFWYDDPRDPERSHAYLYELAKSDTGWVLIGENNTTISIEQADVDHMEALIREYNLASINGRDESTAGLPEGIGEYAFSIAYESGETITAFDNAGGEPVVEAFTGPFRNDMDQVFQDHGHPEIGYAPEVNQIQDMNLEFEDANADGSTTYYLLRAGNDPDSDEMVLAWECYVQPADSEDSEVVFQKQLPWTTALANQFSELALRTGMTGLPSTEVTFGIPEGEGAGYAICLNFVKGNQVYSEARGDSCVSDWPAMHDEILSCAEGVFD